MTCGDGGVESGRSCSDKVLVPETAPLPTVDGGGDGGYGLGYIGGIQRVVTQIGLEKEFE